MATLSFYGLCGISVQDDIKGIMGFKLYLLGDGNSAQEIPHGTPGGLHVGGHGSARHSTTLVVRIKDVDIKSNRGTNWPAEDVGYDATGHQIGIWRIPAGTRITAEAGANFGGWKSRNQAIDLAAHHPQAHTAQQQGDKTLSIVELVNGRLESAIGIQPLTLSVNGREFPGIYAQAVKWDAGDHPVILHIRGCGGDDDEQTIELRPAAEASVTNVAKVPAAEGLEHFQHYYRVIKDGGQPGTLRHGGPSDVKTMDVPVYDCVPPTALP